MLQQRSDEDRRTGPVDPERADQFRNIGIVQGFEVYDLDFDEEITDHEYIEAYLKAVT